jgi:predicted Zn-dependent peptidase
MARSIKIPCEGAIYTVHSDAYGTVTNVNLDAGAATDAPSDSDEAMDEERARYAQILRELTEFEEAVAEAEELNLLAEDPNGDDDDDDLD